MVKLENFRLEEIFRNDSFKRGCNQKDSFTTRILKIESQVFEAWQQYNENAFVIPSDFEQLNTYVEAVCDMISFNSENFYKKQSENSKVIVYNRSETKLLYLLKRFTILFCSWEFSSRYYQIFYYIRDKVDYESPSDIFSDPEASSSDSMASFLVDLSSNHIEESACFCVVLSIFSALTKYRSLVKNVLVKRNNAKASKIWYIITSSEKYIRKLFLAK